MKKIIFCDIPMRNDLKSVIYNNSGNKKSSYSKPVFFAINLFLANQLKKNDEVKVVLLRTKTETGSSEKNTELLKNELNEINSQIGARIEYEIIDSEFVETKDNYEVRLKAMLNKLEENSCIYADITYGPKPLPMILMCVLSFAEKFFHCDIKNIVYGKVDFVNGKPENPELYDVTSLYYLNNLTFSMVASNGKDAIQNLNEFFAL